MGQIIYVRIVLMKTYHSGTADLIDMSQRNNHWHVSSSGRGNSNAPCTVGRELSRYVVYEDDQMDTLPATPYPQAIQQGCCMHVARVHLCVLHSCRTKIVRKGSLSETNRCSSSDAIV